MAEPFNALAGAFSLGIQTNEATQATKMNTTLATVSGLGVRFDTRQPLNEHPGGGGSRSFEVSSPLKRTAYETPFKATFLMRPKFLPMGLIASGWKCVTTAGPEASTYTHTLTIEVDASMKWMTAAHNVGGTGSGFTRVGKAARVSRFSFNAGREQIECSIDGIGKVEATLSGAPTYTSEVTDEYSCGGVGSITCTLAGTTLIDTVLGITGECNNGLRNDIARVPLFTAGSKPLTRTKLGFTGTLTGVPALSDLVYRVYRGAAGNAAPTLSAQVGALAYSFISEANMPGKANPYSVSWTVPACQFELPETIDNNADDDVRADVTYTMIASVAEPVTVVVINDQALYVV